MMMIDDEVVGATRIPLLDLGSHIPFTYITKKARFFASKRLNFEMRKI